jgi:hypothetical protein
MANPSNWNLNTITSPALSATALSPSDTVNLTSGFKSLYVGGAGDITLVTYSDEVVTFVGVLAGSILPVVGYRVNSTGTTATSIVALR